MRADLHLHSRVSDGANPPAALCRIAKEHGLMLFSLTDHDTMAGSGEAAEAARELGLRFVRGWEVSSYIGACKVHMLGYGCGMGSIYEDFLEERRQGALVRAREMREKANAHFGLNVTEEEVERFHPRKEAPIHTMAVVSAFAERLHRDKGGLYTEAFAWGGAAFSGECRPSPVEAIEIIHALGGLAVLAHPGRILALSEEDILKFRALPAGSRGVLQQKSDAARARMMGELVKSGLDGIECYYTTHTAIETEYFLSFAAENGLFVTGGSDFHEEDGRHIVGSPAFDARAVEEMLLSLDGSV